MLILGHRGTGITMRNNKAQEKARHKTGKRGPENTLKAFELALKGGADGLELDVIRTKDNDLAVIHDQALNLHIAGAHRRRRTLGSIKNHTMAQLRSMNVGDGQPIPSLKAVFALAARYDNPILNIELVGKDTYELAYRQAKQSGYPLERIIFSSFDHEQLIKLRSLDSDIKIGLVFEPRILPLGLKIARPGRQFFSEKYTDALLENIKPASLHIWSKDLTSRLKNYARQNKLDIFVWTRKEKHPDQDLSILSFAKVHKNERHTHLITDFPAEIKAGLKF